MKETAQYGAIFLVHGLGDPALFDRAVGVEDVSEQSFVWFDLHVVERRANVDSLLSDFVAGDAGGFLENGESFLGITFFRGENVLVFFHDFGAITVGLTKKLLGESFDFFVGAAAVGPARHGGHHGGADFSGFHLLHQHESATSVAGNEGDSFAPRSWCKALPALEEILRYRFAFVSGKYADGSSLNLRCFGEFDELIDNLEFFFERPLGNEVERGGPVSDRALSIECSLGRIFKKAGKCCRTITELGRCCGDQGGEAFLLEGASAQSF